MRERGESKKKILHGMYVAFTKTKTQFEFAAGIAKSGKTAIDSIHVALSRRTPLSVQKRLGALGTCSSNTVEEPVNTKITKRDTNVKNLRILVWRKNAWDYDQTKRR